MLKYYLEGYFIESDVFIEDESKNFDNIIF